MMNWLRMCLAEKLLYWAFHVAPRDHLLGDVVKIGVEQIFLELNERDT